MKETVNVNIGSLAFTLDDDAYHKLKHYLAEIERHLPTDDRDTLGDIECRIAELLKERISSPLRVVSLAEVEEVMHRMGHPEEFAADGNSRTQEEQEANPGNSRSNHRRIFRSRSNRSIAGICSGLAYYLGCDVTLLRLITLFLILFGGLSIWVYIILWAIIPEEPVRTIHTH